MLMIISPAKTMTGKSVINAPEGSLPRFRKEAVDIALQMAQYPSEELGRILRLNKKLTAEVYGYFQEFHSADNHPLQALLAYTGIVYKYIHPQDFTEEDFSFAQDHLRIVSAAYGLLRPLDLIKLYRMEYDVQLPELGDGNMYSYWPSRQTKTLIKDTRAAGNIIVNLASVEIQPAFDWKKIRQSFRIITPEFRIWKNGKYKTVVIYLKMARGKMARYIIRNRLSDPEELKLFTWEGFTYNEHLSDGDNWVFTQE